MPSSDLKAVDFRCVVNPRDLLEFSSAGQEPVKNCNRKVRQDHGFTEQVILYIITLKKLIGVEGEDLVLSFALKSHVFGSLLQISFKKFELL